MDPVSIIFEILFFTVIPFISVFFIAFLFRIFVKEDFSTWMGIIIGLAFVGFDIGIVGIAKSATPITFLKYLVIMIISAWAARFGNKYGKEFLKHQIRVEGYHILKRGIYKASGKKFIEITMPSASEIQNIYGKRSVSNDLKRELGGRKFVEPADLPVEILEARIKRRLITDWRIGDAEVKLNAMGVVVKLAVSAKKSRLGGKLPEGKVLFSFKPESVPFELCYGDRVDVFIDNIIVREAEVLNVEDGAALVTLPIADAELLAAKIGKGMRPAVIALPIQTIRQRSQDKKENKK